nr:ribonuclease H-like domain-containing protein [Tanacetum cinerariifolium]
MAAGSKERPPMLATGRYAQWQSRFLRYVDTKPDKKELRQCIFDGPYVMTEIIILAKLETTTEEAVPEHTIVETYKNTTPKNVLTLMLKLKQFI